MTASLSTRTPQQAIAALLASYAREKLLLLGASELPAVSAFHSAHPQCQVTTAPAAPLAPELAAQRFDLAILVDCLEHLPKRDGLQLLGGIRNLNASRVAVLLDLKAGDWQ